MFTLPNAGWTNWDMENFKERISYVDNFPLNLLNGIKEFFNTETCQEIEFDAEGYLYTIYLGYPIYAKIEDGDMNVIHEDMVLFSTEVLNDIEKNIKEWSCFPWWIHTDEEQENLKKELEEEIAEIRGLIEQWLKKTI